MRFTHTQHTDSAVKFLMFCTHIFECQIWEAAASLKLSADAGKHWWLMNAWCLNYQGPRTVSSAVGNNSDMPQNRYIYNNIYIHLYNYIYNIHVHLDIYILYLYIHKTYFVDISNNWGRHTTSDLEVRSWGNMTARDYYRWYRWYLTAGGPVSSRIGQTSLERHKSKRGTWRDVTSHNNSKPMIVINQ